MLFVFWLRYVCLHPDICLLGTRGLQYTVHPGDIMIQVTAPEDRIIYSGKRVTEKVTERVTERVTVKESAVLFYRKQLGNYRG